MFTTAAHADVLLGLGAPLTGATASFGAQLDRGARAAVADLNANGGVLGQKVILEEGDDQCDPKQAVAVANRMATKGVKAVIGHFCSGSSIPASDVYAEENLIEISPASSNPSFTEAGKANVFRVCGRDDQQGGLAAKFLADTMPQARIAIIDDKQAYGAGFADEFRKALHKAGLSEVSNDRINPGEHDYFAILTKLKRRHVDVLFYGGQQIEAGLLVRQMRELGMATVMIAGDGIASHDFRMIAGPGSDGTLMTFPPDPAKDPSNDALVARFKAEGSAPEGYTLYTYGAVQAWAQAVTQAGSFDTAKVEAVLHNARFDTVLGRIGFDSHGDILAPGYVVYKWQGGEYDYLKP